MNLGSNFQHDCFWSFPSVYLWFLFFFNIHSKTHPFNACQILPCMLEIHFSPNPRILSEPRVFPIYHIPYTIFNIVRCNNIWLWQISWKKLILFFLSFLVSLGTIWFCSYLFHNIFLSCFGSFIFDLMGAFSHWLFHHACLLFHHVFFSTSLYFTQHQKYLVAQRNFIMLVNLSAWTCFNATLTLTISLSNQGIKYWTVPEIQHYHTIHATNPQWKQFHHPTNFCSNIQRDLVTMNIFSSSTDASFTALPPLGFGATISSTEISTSVLIFPVSYYSLGTTEKLTSSPHLTSCNSITLFSINTVVLGKFFLVASTSPAVNQLLFLIFRICYIKVVLVI